MVTTLLLMDMQGNMPEAPDPVLRADRVLAVADALLERARAGGARVVHVRADGAADDPALPGGPGRRLRREPVGGEAIVERLERDAFAGTGLARLLPAGSTVVAAGPASEHCLRATVLSGLRQGYVMRVVRGGYGGYGETGERGERGEPIERELERQLREAGAEIVGPHQPLFGAVRGASVGD